MQVSQSAVDNAYLLSGLGAKRDEEDKDLKEDEEYASDDLSENEERLKIGKEAPSRSSRGLKVLSVRVRELVFEKQVTTYKEVADELIQELLKEGKMSHDKHNVTHCNIHRQRMRRMLGDEFMMH